MKYNRLLNKHEQPTKLNITVSPSEESAFSRIFKHTANASQVGLLILAIFGYFYTVVPVYEKALLDEKIAKKEIELSEKSNELNKKMAELKSLNLAITEIKEKLISSKSEANKLRKTVSGQYNELRHRLIDEYKYIANQECQINIITEKLFSTCIKEKVLSSYNLKPLRKIDKTLLYNLSKDVDSELSNKWKQKFKSLQERRKEIELKFNGIKFKCDERRKSPDYKDKIKKIEIDYLCQKDLNEIKYEEIKIELDANFSPREITNSFTERIKSKFIDRM